MTLRSAKLSARRWVLGTGGLVLLGMLAMLSAPNANAITHANGLKFPLTEPLAECGADQSTTNCSLGNTQTAEQSRTGSVGFGKGTVEIKNNGKVSLRLDNVHVINGDCPSGLLCRCGGGTGACDNDGDCGSGSEGSCNVPENTVVELEIWAQNHSKNNVLLVSPCDTNSCIRRSHSNSNDCHQVFEFTLGTGAAVGDVNASTGTGAFACNGAPGLARPEIRDVEVRLKDAGNDFAADLFGVMGFK